MKSNKTNDDKYERKSSANYQIRYLKMNQLLELKGNSNCKIILIYVNILHHSFIELYSM